MYFNPHSPCGERHQKWLDYVAKRFISIHTPHAGSDARYSFSWLSFSLFQSTLPMRGATANDTPKGANNIFQSTLPMRGATGADPYHAGSLGISIHTPHAGSDSLRLWASVGHQNFNPHSPCGERLSIGNIVGTAGKFQSTLPMRGATSACSATSIHQLNFNPHSPCGERPFSKNVK